MSPWINNHHHTECWQFYYTLLVSTPPATPIGSLLWNPGAEEGRWADAPDDLNYHNPTAGQAFGGGEEEEPEAMTDAASAVYEMLLSSDASILDNLMVMVELFIARREPLAVAPPTPPTLPSSPPVPPPTPPLPPPPPSFLLTLLLDPTFRPRLSETV